ncbi:hypothetical protein M427DRAFT_38603 [Gonapodya prolifera JEL478]|uniref:Uncharacterized protein n=1 Tax=Gonapodya prolifera (strain JEL478) TaxID=1344416 RepID=A0A138ZYS6_GONPJ|nr:hypothetical protein M427DRAFT_38603 [Gonapodya prolifera JEL478]|eukprot:KXS09666.1 hypothetical protein M427DRAFT_38603 [Gonapodya prolifera JEL478]
MAEHVEGGHTCQPHPPGLPNGAPAKFVLEAAAPQPADSPTCPTLRISSLSPSNALRPDPPRWIPTSPSRRRRGKPSTSPLPPSSHVATP